MPQARAHPVARVLKTQELDAALDRDAHLAQPLDQHSLVLILRVDERIRKRAQPHPAIAEARTGDLPALDPEIGREEANAALDHGRGETDLLVKLECARLHRECA